MVNLDMKDRKILYELDLNCRQSNTQIGKKVGLSRKVVEYRIKRMEDEGIITGYWTAIDTFMLGYQVIRVYLIFQDITSKIKEDLIDYFSNCKESWAVISVSGEIEFAVIFWVKDFNWFHNFWNKTLDKYGKYFSKQTISTLNQVISYNRNFLIPDEKYKHKKELYRTSSVGQNVIINKVDFNILNELAVNARIKLVDLSKNLNLSSQTVKNRIDNLTKKGIIKAFRVYINFSKIGLQKFVIWIYLKNHSKKLQIINYFKDKPYLEYSCEAIGWSDLQFEIIVKNLNKLLEIIELVENKFLNSIRKQSFVIPIKYHKERWLPEMDFK